MKTVPASGPRNARIAIVGMAPASQELIEGKPFVGYAGRILNNALAKLGKNRADVFITNVCDFPIRVGSSIFDLPYDVQQRAVARLKQELEQVNPNVIVPLGAEPLYFICSKRDILNQRGSILPSTLLPGKKCVPSVHPAWLIRGMMKWEPVFTHIDLKRAFEESSHPEIRLPKREAITGPSFSTACDILTEAATRSHVAFDYEIAYWRRDKTGGHMGHVACVSICYENSWALSLPFIRGNGQSYWTPAEEVRLWQLYAHILQNHHVKKIAQNASFEWIYSWHHNIFPWPLYIDTMTLHRCLYPDFGGSEDFWRSKRSFDAPGHSLAFITSCYTRTPYYKDDGKLWNPALGDHQFWRYNAMDAMVTYESALAMYHEALDDKLWDYYNKFYIRPFHHALRMEWYGTPIDVALRTEVGKELNVRIDELQVRINDTLGYALNVNSSKQMTNLLYKERGYQVKTNLKTKRPTADKNAINYFAEKNDDPILRMIAELRRLIDMRTDVIEQPLDSNNYIHTHYKLGGADSERWSSTRSILGTGTNLQNIPRDGIARELFTANDLTDSESVEGEVSTRTS